MRYDEIKVARANSRYLYHATISKHIENIFKQGLVPNTKRESNWNFANVPHGVTFFADTAKNAVYYANIVSQNQHEHLGYGGRPYVVLLRTRKRTVPIIADQHTQGDYYTQVVVPPDQLEILIHGKWRPLLQTQVAVEGMADGDWDDEGA